MSLMGKNKSQQTPQTRFFIVNDPFAPRLSPELAAEIGLHESIILLQLEYWITHLEHIRDGYRWTYQSTSSLKEKFPFMSASTIKRTISSLITQNLIIAANYNQHTFDRTRWFRINPEGAAKLKSVSLVAQDEPCMAQDGPRRAQDGPRSGQIGPTIPKTSTKRSTKREEAALAEYLTSPVGIERLRGQKESTSRPKENSKKDSKGKESAVLAPVSGDVSLKDDPAVKIHLDNCPLRKQQGIKRVHQQVIHDEHITDLPRWLSIHQMWIAARRNYHNVDYMLDVYGDRTDMKLRELLLEAGIGDPPERRGLFASIGLA